MDYDQIMSRTVVLAIKTISDCIVVVAVAVVTKTTF